MHIAGFLVTIFVILAAQILTNGLKVSDYTFKVQ